MGIDLYYMAASPSCRSVLMLAKAVEVELNLITTNLMAKEHLSEEFLALNPQHTIPTIDDNGFVLCESRAILAYLAEKYGDSVLIPSTPEGRAIVNQRLYFDLGVLWPCFRDYYMAQLRYGKEPDEEQFKKVQEGIGWLDGFLEGKEWAAGDELTIADFALAATYSSFDAAGFDGSAYPNVINWFEKCKAELPGYEVNQEGLNEFKQLFGL